VSDDAEHMYLLWGGIRIAFIKTSKTQWESENFMLVERPDGQWVAEYRTAHCVYFWDDGTAQYALDSLRRRMSAEHEALARALGMS